ncbi:hypothetical protein TorRG33x02_191400 [Trema orientale]|uniref:Uncharacterized protein n=1 Tax=Trema orientale TaxID=63057 RepID=A0A2P5EHM0_TREOI|nr:hypothetical protein TorRG33x02_191400 [Trema orientale]
MKHLNTWQGPKARVLSRCHVSTCMVEESRCTGIAKHMMKLSSWVADTWGSQFDEMLAGRCVKSN